MTCLYSPSLILSIYALVIGSGEISTAYLFAPIYSLLWASGILFSIKKLKESEELLRFSNLSFERDLQNAQLFQKALLPGSVPEFKSLNIEYRNSQWMQSEVTTFHLQSSGRAAWEFFCGMFKTMV